MIRKLFTVSGSTSTSVGIVAVAEYHGVSPQFYFTLNLRTGNLDLRIKKLDNAKGGDAPRYILEARI